MESMVTGWRNYRFSALLAALLLFFVAAPFYQALLSPIGANVMSLAVYALVLFAAIRVTQASLNLRIGLTVLALSAAVFQAAVFITGSNTLAVAFHLVSFVFLAAVTIVTVARLMRSGTADYETIAASICGYVLLVVLWANAYSLIEIVSVGSFSAAQASTESGRLMQFGLGDAMMSLYYSFVTMTTLGYGDVLPVTPTARVFASMQAFVGQVYIAVIVARLVGLEIATRVSAR